MQLAGVPSPQLVAPVISKAAGAVQTMVTGVLIIGSGVGSDLDLQANTQLATSIDKNRFFIEFCLDFLDFYFNLRKYMFFCFS